MGAMKAQESLRVCTGLHEPLLLAYAISTYIVFLMNWFIYMQEITTYLSLQVKDTMNYELILRTGKEILGLPSIESLI